MICTGRFVSNYSNCRNSRNFCRVRALENEKKKIVLRNVQDLVLRNYTENVVLRNSLSLTHTHTHPHTPEHVCVCVCVCWCV